MEEMTEKQILAALLQEFREIRSEMKKITLFLGAQNRLGERRDKERQAAVKASVENLMSAFPPQMRNALAPLFKEMGS